MSRKAEYDNTGAEDPRGDGDLPEWLEEEIEGKSKREQERIIRGYREEAMAERMNPMQRDGVRVEVLKPSGHLKVSAMVGGKREWIRYAGLSRQEAVDDFKETFKYREEAKVERMNPLQGGGVRVEVLKPSGHLKVSAMVGGKREWIRYAGLSREEAVDDFKEVFKLHGKDRSIRRNPSVNPYVEIEYSHGGNIKTVSVPFEQSSRTIKKILSTGAMLMKVKGTVPASETLQSVMKKISPVRRNPYVESGAYIIPDNDINKRAARMA